MVLVVVLVVVGSWSWRRSDAMLLSSRVPSFGSDRGQTPLFNGFDYLGIYFSIIAAAWNAETIMIRPLSGAKVHVRGRREVSQGRDEEANTKLALP